MGRGPALPGDGSRGRRAHRDVDPGARHPQFLLLGAGERSDRPLAGRMARGAGGRLCRIGRRAHQGGRAQDAERIIARAGEHYVPIRCGMASFVLHRGDGSPAMYDGAISYAQYERGEREWTRGCSRRWSSGQRTSTCWMPRQTPASSERRDTGQGDREPDRCSVEGPGFRTRPAPVPASAAGAGCGAARRRRRSRHRGSTAPSSGSRRHAGSWRSARSPRSSAARTPARPPG